MPNARVVQTGQGQTVHLPADIHIDGSLVDAVAKADGSVELRPTQEGPQSGNGLEIYELLLQLSDLIGDPPDDPPSEDRPGL